MTMKMMSIAAAALAAVLLAGTANAAVVLDAPSATSVRLPGFSTVSARYREFESVGKNGNDFEHFPGHGDLGGGAGAGSRCTAPEMRARRLSPASPAASVGHILDLLADGLDVAADALGGVAPGDEDGDAEKEGGGEVLVHRYFPGTFLKGGILAGCG